MIISILRAISRLYPIRRRSPQKTSTTAASSEDKNNGESNTPAGKGKGKEKGKGWTLSGQVVHPTPDIRRLLMRE